MKRLTVLIFVVGLLVITGLVISHGAGDIWRALSAIGWLGFALVSLFHFGVFALMGASWRVITPRTPGVRRGAFIWARLIRDSGAEVLPLSQLGGFVMGARAAILAGISGTVAAASTIVDVTLELFAQLAFTAIGLAVLLAVRPDTAIATPAAVGLVVMFAAAIAFMVAQRRGLSLAARIGKHLLGDWADKGLSLAAVEGMIGAIYARPRRIGLSTLLHLACWLASAAEAWFALRLMDVPVGFGSIVAIESLLYAVRSVAFAVPNAVGIQEGAYLVLGGVFGIPADTLLALSLLKRARDFALGVPALLVWQAIEARRAWFEPEFLSDSDKGASHEAGFKQATDPSMGRVVGR